MLCKHWPYATKKERGVLQSRIQPNSAFEPSLISLKAALGHNGDQMNRRFAWIAASFLIVGCAGSRVSLTETPSPITESVKTIALAPGGGSLADAIGVELSNNGFNVIDEGAMTALMDRLNLDEFELTEPQSLSKLKDTHIDAYLSVKAAAGFDGRPHSARVRLISTTDGKVLAGVSWQNGWGGLEGSPADQIMRKGLTGAAAEIAGSLVQRIRSEVTKNKWVP
jgi:hypothetical protein